jgi:hypothetical protein
MKNSILRKAEAPCPAVISEAGRRLDPVLFQIAPGREGRDSLLKSETAREHVERNGERLPVDVVAR